MGNTFPKHPVSRFGKALLICFYQPIHSVAHNKVFSIGESSEELQYGERARRIGLDRMWVNESRSDCTKRKEQISFQPKIRKKENLPRLIEPIICLFQTRVLMRSFSSLGFVLLLFGIRD